MRTPNLLVTTSAKVAMGVIPFCGEIQWQLEGSPGRKSFEPLEHLGNMGLPPMYVLTSGLLMNEYIGNHVGLRYVAQRQAQQPYNSYQEQVEGYIQARERFQRGVFAPFTLALNAAAQIYSETIGSGTHDYRDAIYGMGSAVVALGIYSKIHRLELGRKRTQLMSHVPLDEAPDQHIPQDVTTIAPASPGNRTASVDKKRRRIQQQAGRRANRKK